MKAKSAPKEVSPKLTIASQMAAVDGKKRGFYDDLTSDEKKKFSTYLMLRYCSCVEGSPDMQAYYLMSTNAKFNKNYFSIPGEHVKLNWLAISTISPGMGNQRHTWIAATAKAPTSKSIKFLAEIYPDLKQEDLELMAKINDDADLKQLATEYGWTKDQIKKAFG